MARAFTLAACYAVYNEEEFLEYSIRSVYAAVDRVIVCLGLAPWNAYNPQARELYGRRDTTEAIVDRLARELPNITVIKDIWDSEVAQRQTAMARCVAERIDYFFLVDGDEVYRADHLAFIREQLAAYPAVGTFHIKCTVLWRSFRYRIPYWGVKWTPWRIFQVTRHRCWLGWRLPYQCRVIGPNRANSLGPRHLIPPDRAIFYHLGYARNTERMRLKFGTSEGRSQFQEGWFERVWLKWPSERSMKNLQPVDPEGLPEALPVDPEDLPEVLRAHPYWPMDIIP